MGGGGEDSKCSVWIWNILFAFALIFLMVMLSVLHSEKHFQKFLQPYIASVTCRGQVNSCH